MYKPFSASIWLKLLIGFVPSLLSGFIGVTVSLKLLPKVEISVVAWSVWKMYILSIEETFKLLLRLQFPTWKGTSEQNLHWKLQPTMVSVNHTKFFVSNRTRLPETFFRRKNRFSIQKEGFVESEESVENKLTVLDALCTANRTVTWMLLWLLTFSGHCIKKALIIRSFVFVPLLVPCTWQNNKNATTPTNNVFTDWKFISKNINTSFDIPICEKLHNYLV